MTSNHWIQIPCITCIHCGKSNGRLISVDPTVEPPLPLLRENFIPSPEEEIHTRTLMDDAILEIKALDQDISQLQATIEQLNAKKALLDAYARGHQGTLSPIRRLPNEILDNIFTFCATNDPSASQSDSSRWRLCRVNTRWRQLALSHHQLWASINVKFFRMGLKLPLEKITFCFEYSGMLPITLSLENPAIVNSPLPIDLLSPILSEKPRVRALILGDLMLPPVKCFNVSTLCNLEVLDILATNAHSKWIEQIFEVAPGLVRVAFKISEIPLEGLHIPWHRITCLILTTWLYHIDGNTTLNILSGMPQLIELGLLHMPSPDSHPRPLTLPNVQKLHFFYKKSRYSFLELLTLPALTCFNIQIGTTQRSLCFRLVESMFQRSACKLESLIIVDDNISKLPLLFPSVPYLKELDLRLTGPVSDDKFLKLKWIPHSTTRKFPYLETIRIHFPQVHNVDFNIWTEIMHSRCEAVSCSRDCQFCTFPARLRELYIITSRFNMNSPPRHLLNKMAEDHRVNLFVLPPRGHNIHSAKYFEKEIARV